MGNVFEDQFMDLQSEYISLCLDFARQKVNKVYAYCSIEEKSKMFNAFFEIAGEIRTTGQLGVGDGEISQFLRTGTLDLKRFQELCERYHVSTPTEIKMCYDASTGKYDAAYKYDVVCSAKTGVSAGEVFTNWLAEVKNSLV